VEIIDVFFLLYIVLSFGAGGNPAAQSSGGAIMSARKLDDATEAGTIAKVDIALSKAIMQARMAKKLSQNDLAKLINEKGTTIQQYESGKAIPNPQIIAKLEKQLGCKLPRPGKSKVAPKEGTAASSAAAAMAKKTGGGVTRGGPPKRR
jgi:putative transcription factor